MDGEEVFMKSESFLFIPDVFVPKGEIEQSTSYNEPQVTPKSSESNFLLTVLPLLFQ